MSNGKTKITNLLESDDVMRTLEILRQLGVKIIKSKNYNYEIDIGKQKIGDNFIKDRELMREISVDQVFNTMKEKQNWKI